MDRREWCELTNLCLLSRDGKVLLQNRVKKDWQGYALPGGHVEPGESIVDSCIREMREETGLTVKEPKLCGVKQFPIKGGRYLVFLFKADTFEGTLRSSQEGKVEWVELDSLGEYPTVMHLKELIDVMLSDNLHEFQYILEGEDWIPVLR